MNKTSVYILNFVTIFMRKRKA